MASYDPYRFTNELDETALDTLVERLEGRGQNPIFAAMLAEYLDELQPSTLGRVIEVGCGTGVAARALARRDDFEGTIFASDISTHLVDKAQALAAAEGIADRISFSAADAESALSADGICDAVIAHTLVSHVPDPGAIVGAAARAIGPGGTVAIFDGDYQSITLGSEDAATGAEIAQAMIGGLFTSPTIMREMPWVAQRNGLRVERTFGHVLSEIGYADFFAGALASMPVMLPRAGVADEETVQGWVAEQNRYAEEGTFFGAINFYTYLLRPGA